MFKKLLDRMLAANTNEEINDVLYAAGGVDLQYQHGKITWEDHERLFTLAARLQK